MTEGTGKKKKVTRRKHSIVRKRLAKEQLKAHFPGSSSSADFNVAFTSAMVHLLVHDLKRAKYIASIEDRDKITGCHMAAVHDYDKINPAQLPCDFRVKISKGEFIPSCD